MRVVIVGCGEMGRRHLRIAQASARVEVLALVDLDMQRAQAAAQDGECLVFCDLTRALSDVAADCVIIATPTKTHVELCEIALRSDCHVLVESPICLSPAHGMYLARIAQERGKILSVSHAQRFNPAVTTLQTLLSKQLLGPVWAVDVRREELSWDASGRDRGGVALERSVVELDLVRLLLGTEFSEVYAYTSNLLPGAAEDGLSAIARLCNGVAMNLHVDRVSPRRCCQFIFRAMQGLYLLDLEAQTLEVVRMQNEVGLLDATLPAGMKVADAMQPIVPEDPLAVQLRRFVDAVAHGRAAPVSPADAVVAVDVALALMQSSQTQRLVALERPESESSQAA